MTHNYNKEIRAVVLIVAFKLLILLLLPLTGDEAYFISWARHLMPGYYDHPPMVGWLIYLMSFVSDNYLFYRLFSFVTMLAVAYILYRMLTLHVSKEIALLSALALLASPVDLLVVMITNDIPLLLFGSLGTLFLLYSFETKQWLRYSVLSGIFLGLAFLSKYFAVFLMLGLLLFVGYTYRKRALKNSAVILMVVLLFVAQNLYFNYHNCWNNILFNFLSRTAQSHFQFKSVVLYFITLLYLVTPWGLYYLIQARFSMPSVTLRNLSIAVLSVALGIFFIVSLKKSIGLHWLLLFIPYLFMLFSCLNPETLRTLIRYNARFSYLHITLLLIILMVPISLFKEHKKYGAALLFVHPQSICKALDAHNISRLFAYGYSTAALLSYHCNRDIHMLYNTNKYGRLDDKLFDITTLQNQTFTLFDKRAFNTRDTALFTSTCNRITIEDLPVEGATYHLLTCEGFDYDAYKTTVLNTIKEKFYTLPSWLPRGDCYFLQRYYP